MRPNRGTVQRRCCAERCSGRRSDCSMKGQVCRRWRCWATRCTRRSGLDDCGLLKKSDSGGAGRVSSKSERSQTDSEAPMGNATTRSLERVAAARGSLGPAPVEFEAAWDVAQGGVLLALPALLATGLLRYTPQIVPVAERILWYRQHLSAAGPDGAGADPVAGAVALTMRRRGSGANCWDWTASRKCGRCARS